MEMSNQARELWEKIPTDVRLRLLNNVYCVRCQGISGVGEAAATVLKGDLVIKGSCTKCGGPVSRVVESS